MSKHLFTVCFILLSLDAVASNSIPVVVKSQSASIISQQIEYATQPRVALVVGNSDYQNQPLVTPATDANIIAELLKNRGFDVIRVENATQKTLQQAITVMNTRLGKAGTGLFYFAGHGLLTDETALILPVDTDFASLDSVQRTAFSIDWIVTQMSLHRPNQPNLVIIDSCLNNPYRQPNQGSNTILGYLPKLPEQTLIAFATAPGSIAYDGMAQHGIYANALRNALQQPGLDLNAVFNHVRHTVRVRTRNWQIPWVLSSLDSNITLSPYLQSTNREHLATTSRAISLVQLSTMPTRGILPQDGNAKFELEFWQTIKNSTDASDYEAYLQAYPNGKFAPLAKIRLERYKKSPSQTVKQPANTISELDEVYEVIQNTNVRQTPSTESKPLGQLRRGSTVNVTGKVNNKKWYQVRYGDISGYVFSELLRKAASKEKPKLLSKQSPQPVKSQQTQLGIIVLQDCSYCPVLLGIPAGRYTMGDNQGDRSEKPSHQVSIKQDYAIGKYEVTVAQWNECVKAGACSHKPDLDNSMDMSPIRDVSWIDTQEYVNWLSSVTDKLYRLPTEAEWEYAARGGTKTRFWWGNKVGAGLANCKNCGGKWNNKAPGDVDAFPANPFGLYGTSGGVWEWVADCWHKNYKVAPSDGTAWSKKDCRENVIRGGAWRNDTSYAHSASRFKYDTGVRYIMNGFRVARTLP